MRRAFTLIELLVVIVILGVLMTIVVSVVPNVMVRAKRTKTIAVINAVRTALDQYMDDNQEAVPPIADWKGPEDESGIAVLTKALKGYLRKGKDTYVYSRRENTDVIADAFRRPMRYRSSYDENMTLRPNIHNRGEDYNEPMYDLWSAGPDGKDQYYEPDNGDDICNWERRREE